MAIGQLSGSGLFEKAKKAKIEQMRAEAKENVDLAIMHIQISESEKENKLSLKTLHEQLPTVDNRISSDEYTDGDNTLNVVYTDKKMSFDITIDSSFNVTVAETPKDNNKFTITVDEIKTSSIRVTGDSSSLKDFDVANFTYVAQTSDSNQIKVEHVTDISYTVTGLSQGTTYTVYMLAYDKAGNERKSNVKTVTTESIPDGTKQGAITFGATTWTSGKASIQISTNTNYYIEYQVNGTSGSWTKATTAGTSIKVQNLNHNDIVYARLTDGTSSGNYANVTIVDTIPPEAFTIKVSNASETSIKIEGSTTDAESGIKDYSYYVKTSSGTVVNKKEHTTDTSWEVTGLTNGTEYIVYVIAYDNAGNETKSSEKKITVQKPINYATSGVVQYDAGNWTQEEIQALQSKNLYNINKSKTASPIAELNFTFGGFTYKGDTTNASDIASGNIITSRNQSVNCRLGNNKGIPKYSGWQILESEVKDGKTYVKKIVHAGIPENFVYWYKKSADNKRAEFILSGGTRQTTYNTYQPRDWSMYKDTNLDAKGYIKDVHAMDYSEALAITGNEESTNGLRNNGGLYWLASACLKGDCDLWIVDDNGGIDGTRNFYNSWCLGVRPVVSLTSGVYIKSGTGTGDDPYILGKD